MSKESQFTTSEIKIMKEKIMNLSSKKRFTELCRIIHKAGEKFTENDNGIILLLNSFRDETLQKIKHYLKLAEEKKQKRIQRRQMSLSQYVPYSTDEYTSSEIKDMKLSNEEKSILKKQHYQRKTENSSETRNSSEAIMSSSSAKALSEEISSEASPALHTK